METALGCLVAFFAAGLTLFSGFGLGTLLMPVLAIFLPIEEAIAITAIAHFLNNLLKLVLLGRYADKYVVVKFGLPALLSAFLGAWVLGFLMDQAPLVSYHLFNREFHVAPVKLTIAILLAVFTLSELASRDGTVSLNKKYLPIGGGHERIFRGAVWTSRRVAQRVSHQKRVVKRELFGIRHRDRLFSRSCANCCVRRVISFTDN